MRLDDAPEDSGSVEDRRGMGGGTKLAVGGGIGSVIVVVLGLIFGVDLNQFVGQRPGQQQGENSKAPDDGYKEFAEKVLGTTTKVWEGEFKKHDHRPYKKPHMVLFSEQVDTGCGNAPSAVGPFYCPADRTVYLDPTFFQELKEKFGGSDK